MTSVSSLLPRLLILLLFLLLLLLLLLPPFPPSWGGSHADKIWEIQEQLKAVIVEKDEFKEQMKSMLKDTAELWTNVTEQEKKLWILEDHIVEGHSLSNMTIYDFDIT